VNRQVDAGHRERTEEVAHLHHDWMLPQVLRPHDDDEEPASISPAIVVDRLPE
jgi:hypothetical protein